MATKKAVKKPATKKAAKKTAPPAVKTKPAMQDLQAWERDEAVACAKDTSK